MNIRFGATWKFMSNSIVNSIYISTWILVYILNLICIWDFIILDLMLKLTHLTREHCTLVWGAQTNALREAAAALPPVTFSTAYKLKGLANLISKIAAIAP